MYLTIYSGSDEPTGGGGGAGGGVSLGMTYLALPVVTDARRKRSPVQPDTLAIAFPTRAVATPIRDRPDSAPGSGGLAEDGALSSAFSIPAGGETRPVSSKPPDMSEGFKATLSPPLEAGGEPL